MFIPSFDPLYLLFMLPPLVLSGLASLLLNYWHNKYSHLKNTSGNTGFSVAEKFIANYGFRVQLEKVRGSLSDHYDPRRSVVAISESGFSSASVAAVAVTAHEFGHVEQHQKGSILMTARNILLPMLNISSNLGYFLIILGLTLAFTELAWLGIALFSVSAVFSLLTLPIEIDASLRGLRMIRELNLLSEGEEMSGAKKVLAAAALTYVAALVASLANLAYFVLVVRKRSDD